MISVELAVFVFVVQCLGYIVKGLIGFGNPLISAPLLSMQLDNAVITPGTLLLDAPINAYIAWKNRKKFDWRCVVPVLAAVMVGVVPGTLLLKRSLPWVLKTCLGILVVGLGLEMATRERRAPKASHPAVRTAVAFASGVCAGLFGINMLIISYLERTAKEYDEFKGSLCFLFLAENLFRLGNYWVLGLITKEVLMLGAITVPAAAAGMAISGWIRPKMSEKKLRTGAVVMFLLGGVSIIVKSLLFRS